MNRFVNNQATSKPLMVFNGANTRRSSVKTGGFFKLIEFGKVDALAVGSGAIGIRVRLHRVNETNSSV